MLTHPPMALQTSPRCRQEAWGALWFQARRSELRLPRTLHRKFWEMCLVAQVYQERVGQGGTACGFAVAGEPIPAWLALHGAEVLVTNIASDTPEAQVWAASGQHARGLDDLLYPHILERAAFLERCRWRDVDMRAIPADLGTYQFVWSICALEHLGTRAAGLQFILDAAQCLTPGGWAIHTTEFNCTSTTATLDSAGTVLFVEPDLVWLGERLAQEGIHLLPLDLAPGTGEWDQVVDRPPYPGSVHLNVEFGNFITTCVALIMTREG